MKAFELSILSYNIHKGFTTGNFRFVLSQIREAIRSVGTDLVFLQEVLGEHSVHRTVIKEFPKEPQFEFLADEIWSHFAYGKNAVYDEGHHGNAILSKFPIKHWENIDITSSRFARRGLLHTTLEIPELSTQLHALCLHLDLFKNNRLEQVEKLMDRIRKEIPKDEPIVIGGDFNDWSQDVSSLLEKGLGVREAFVSKTGRHAKSFPSQLPTLRLDRIYTRGLEIQKVKVLQGEPWNRLSDHAALYATFTFSPA